MPDLSALIERLDALTGPSRAVDAEVDAAIFGGRPSHAFTEDCGGARLRRSYEFGTVFLNPDPNDNGGHVLVSHCRTAGKYTASIDTAVALVERVLPGWRIENLCEWDHEVLRARGPWMCDLVPRGKSFADQLSVKCANAPTPAIALVLATLRALHAQEGRNG